MNRRERRSMEKSMGITKYKKTLSLAKRMSRLSENVKSGKGKEQEMADTRRRQDQDSTDNSSAEISSMATSIMIKEGVSFMEALSKATELYKIKDENK